MKNKKNGNIAHHDKISFNEIFNLWVKDKNIDELEVNGSIDGCVVTFFVNQAVAEDFKRFHNSLASIKEVSIKEHKEIHKHKG